LPASAKCADLLCAGDFARVGPLTEELLWQERTRRPDEGCFHSRSPLPLIEGKKACTRLILPNSRWSIAPLSIEASQGAAREQFPGEARVKAKAPSGPGEASGAQEAQYRVPEPLPFRLASHDQTTAGPRADVPEGERESFAPSDVGQTAAQTAAGLSADKVWSSDRSTRMLHLAGSRSRRELIRPTAKSSHFLF